VPSSWNIEHYYDDFNSIYDGKLSSATWELFDRADVCVETRPLDTLDIPYVVNYANACGEEAASIKTDSEFFLNKNKATISYGPQAQVLVHQWAKFKYGVFDEYPSKTFDGNNEEFYINSKGEIEATRCNEKLTGQLRNPLIESGVCNKFMDNGLPHTDCIFEDDQLPKFLNAEFSSLMYKPHLNQVVEIFL
jgi:hypothetical protein